MTMQASRSIPTLATRRSAAATTTTATDDSQAYSPHPPKKSRPSNLRVSGARVGIVHTENAAAQGSTSQSETAPSVAPRQKNARRDRQRSVTPESRPRNFSQVRSGVHVMPTWYHAPFPVPKTQPPSTSLIPTPNIDQPSLISPIPPPQPPRSKQKLPVLGILPLAPQRPPQVITKPITKPETLAPLSSSDTKLWACDRCFKYTTKLDSYLRHKRICKLPNPPGKKVYMKNQHSIWEVDGKSRLYCQNLSLFGKLFIDHKMIAFDVENFVYYVITTSWPDGDYPMGYFSKEKHSADDYNLACIVIFPPHQGHFYGRLLMEFSYYLTRGTSSPGTPERPLSVLGAEVYSNYWCTVVLRALVGIIVDVPVTGDEIQGETLGTGRATPPVKIVEVNDPVNAPGNGVIGQEQGEMIQSQRISDASKRIQEYRQQVLARHRADNRLLLEVRDFEPPPELQHEDVPPVTLRIDLASLASTAHIRQDDCVTALEALGFIDRQDASSIDGFAAPRGRADGRLLSGPPLRKVWDNAEITINLDIVLRACEKWHVRARSVLEEACCLV